MFFTKSVVVLCASLLAQGAVVGPSGLGLSDAATIVVPASMAPTPLATSVIDGSLHQPFSTEGPYEDDTDRHPAPDPVPVPLPAPILPPACPGPSSGSGNPGGGTSSSQIIIVVQTITTTSDNLNTALSGLTTSLQLAQVTSISKVLIQSFTTIVTGLAKAVTTFPGTPPFGDSIAGRVVDTLVEFVKVHQALLATIIGKHTIFAQFRLTAPIVAVVRTLEAGIDAFAFALIRLIPTRRDTVQEQINTLDLTLKTTVKTYSQICTPSLGYPKVKPHCIKVN